MKKQALAYAQAAKAALEAGADAQKAVAMKAYMRDQFEFLGIPQPERKLIDDRFLSEHGLPEPAELEAVVRALWELPEREYAYFALGLLSRTRKNAPPERLGLLEWLIVTHSWWDTVDELAANQVGPLLAKYPELIESVTSRWMDSGHLWLQRTAILFQLKYKAKTDTALLYSYIGRLAGSKEFFIRKAIGWALREYSKTAPEEVSAFVAEHELSPLSKREALKVINRAVALE
ncbi:DNA alkylation repair protein [Paenibacillus koleovorans]|uniref:DNA alkylation repair protein n=1 Tax=Paenibacillus koleovorans TaxID=121608 RepID=UPI000FD9574F